MGDTAVAGIAGLGASELTGLLAGSEVTKGARVLGVERRELGAGQVASCWELSLALDGADEPVTLVAKVPSEDPVSLATANHQHLYEREVRFYESIAPTVQIRTPACHHADFDEPTGRFLLLLESLSPAAACDQLDGLSLARCELAIRELAGLHAPHWGDAALPAAAFIDTVGESLRPLYLEVVPALFGMFLDRYGEELSTEARAVIEWLRPRLGAYMAGRDGPATVTHGDFRTDNLLFDGRGGDVPLATVDWQTIGHGSASLDVAYLLCTSLDVETRRAHEHELLAVYLDRLGELGVRDYPAATLVEDYAFHAFQGVVMLVCASVIVERTDRGDDMFLTMIERSSTAVDDLDARARLVA